MTTSDNTEQDTPRSTWSGMWAVATFIGIPLSIISASKLAFMWFTIGPAPVVANLFEFYSMVVHTIFDPLLPLLQWLDWSWVNWFVSIPYWRDILALYFLFGGANARSIPYVGMAVFGFRQAVLGGHTVVMRIVHFIRSLILLIILVLWPLVLLITLAPPRIEHEVGHYRRFWRNTLYTLGGVILVILGNAGLNAG